MSIEERVKVLEKKLEGLSGNLLKEEAKSPYEKSSKKPVVEEVDMKNG